MDDWTTAALEELSGHLASIARRLGELTLAHERLAARRAGGEPPGEHPPGAAPAAEPDLARAAPNDAVARRDRIEYLETARAALHRLLFVVDFTLVHDRVDPALLRDARVTLVDGVDAVNACLLLDGVGTYGDDPDD